MKKHKKKEFAYSVERWMHPEDIEKGQEEIKTAAKAMSLTDQETSEWLERHKAFTNTWLSYGKYKHLRDAAEQKRQIEETIGGLTRIHHVEA